MAAPGGIGKLREAKDLYAKLGRDHTRFKSAPMDEDAAFNFFVTAIIYWNGFIRGTRVGHNEKRAWIPM